VEILLEFLALLLENPTVNLLLLCHFYYLSFFCTFIITYF
jgi:hypothetical protein